MGETAPVPAIGGHQGKDQRHQAGKRSQRYGEFIHGQ